MKTFRRAIAPFVVIAFAATMSCAGHSKDKKSTEADVPGMRQKDINSWANSLGGSGYTRTEKGQWVPKDGGKRSSFEAKGESPYFKGEYAGKEYKAGDYAKKAWLGGKSYDRKVYQGDTDGGRFVKNSRFNGKNAHEDKQSAREAAQPANEGKRTYATGEAHESEAKTLPKPVDAESADKRYPRPDIIDWQEQRALSIEQTK
ncbi:MAG TPA: hypothetical protein VIM57_09545, partial [Luteolibacter sp.]